MTGLSAKRGIDLYLRHLAIERQLLLHERGAALRAVLVRRAARNRRRRRGESLAGVVDAAAHPRGWRWPRYRLWKRRGRAANWADETSQKPQMSRHGPRASFAFELDTYCVNGYATQAKERVAARRARPKRHPTSASPAPQ